MSANDSAAASAWTTRDAWPWGTSLAQPSPTACIGCTPSSAALADQLVFEAFPECAGRVECFGFDWLGRQFSLDRTRGVSGDPDALLFDVGAGEAWEIPVAFSRLHDEELVDYSDAALASQFFAEWFQSHPEPIAFDACVGYRVPLFMGGTDTLPNLELSDLDVYWSLTGQLRLAARATSRARASVSINRSDPTSAPAAGSVSCGQPDLPQTA